MMAASVTAGRLPDGEPRWSEARELPVEPPAEAIDPAAGPTVFGLARYLRPPVRRGDDGLHPP